jgi:hypothetical protein
MTPKRTEREDKRIGKQYKSAVSPSEAIDTAELAMIGCQLRGEHDKSASIGRWVLHSNQQTFVILNVTEDGVRDLLYLPFNIGAKRRSTRPLLALLVHL